LKKKKKSWRELHTNNPIAGSLPPGMPRAHYQGMWTMYQSRGVTLILLRTGLQGATVLRHRSWVDSDKLPPTICTEGVDRRVYCLLTWNVWVLHSDGPDFRPCADARFHSYRAAGTPGTAFQGKSRIGIKRGILKRKLSNIRVQYSLLHHFLHRFLSVQHQIVTIHPIKYISKNSNLSLEDK
jgi:hypothetical protein